jgi:quercetin dioxygenase-like cupin family protein
MKGKFFTKDTVERDELNWGTIGWLSRPSTTGAKQLAVLDVTLEPGFGHNFHKHPNQEEVIFVVKGTIEQWLEQEKRTLGPGDAVFIPADTVHASFNEGDTTAHLIAILGPCVGEAGYELVDVSDKAPWNTLR